MTPECHGAISQRRKSIAPCSSHVDKLFYFIFLLLSRINLDIIKISFTSLLFKH